MVHCVADLCAAVLRYRRVPRALPAFSSLLLSSGVRERLGGYFWVKLRSATILFKFSTVVRRLSKMATTKCFFDIDIGGQNAGRVEMEVSKMTVISGDKHGRRAIAFFGGGTRAYYKTQQRSLMQKDRQITLRA